MALNKGKNRVNVVEDISRMDVKVIHITEDKLENILTKYVHRIKKSQDVLGALALLASLIMTLCTAEFKEFLSMSGEMIKGMFILFTIAAAVYCIYVIWNKCKHNINVSNIMDEIKRRD